MTLAYQPSLLDDSPAESMLGNPGEPGAPGELGPLGEEVRRIPLFHGAWLDLRPGWVTRSDALFERLVELVPWKADRRQMYDRVIEVPRLVSWFGQGAALPDPLLSLARAELDAHYALAGADRFSTAGLCFYRTGDDSVAWHGDRAGRAAVDTRVAILSVGAARTLSVRPRGGGETLKFPLGHGDLLVMGGSCQRTYDHAILKTARAVGPRISVQFRPAWSRADR